MKRTFAPGSEWLYLKLYTGHKSADRLLYENIRPMIHELYKEKAIDGFFFIRYGDPKFHIRLRLRIPDVSLYGVVFSYVNRYFSDCIENGAIWDFQCATYRRELERYGSDTIELVESVFEIDSQAVLDILDRLEEELEEENDPDGKRWMTALRMAEDVLTLFGLSDEMKKEFFVNQAAGFRNEFGFRTHTYIRQLDAKFRTNRKTVERVFSGYEDLYCEDILLQRKKMLAPVLERIRAYTQESEPAVSQDYMLSSLVHMTMNRMFRSKNRIFEMVLYDFAARYYQSLLARHTKQKRQ